MNINFHFCQISNGKFENFEKGELDISVAGF